MLRTTLLFVVVLREQCDKVRRPFFERTSLLSKVLVAVVHPTHPADHVAQNPLGGVSVNAELRQVRAHDAAEVMNAEVLDAGERPHPSCRL